jgi:hypothetical protein
MNLLDKLLKKELPSYMDVTLKRKYLENKKEKVSH